jgi:hypothetical protein
MGKRHRRNRGSGLFPGLVILTVGLAFLLDRLDLVEIGSIWQWWPAALILIGIQHLLSPGGLGWGISLVLLGVSYFLIVFHVMGLTWQTGWPLILVSVGLGFIVGAFERPNTEVAHESE